MSENGLEKKWVKRWKEQKAFQPVPDEREKFYLTVAYPYPSGSMHVGHGRTYTVPDVIARFKRMQGYNVLFPMAWHVTGSPVLGIAQRISAGKEDTIRLYGDMYGIPEDTLESFKDPLNIVEYFSEEYQQVMTRLGYSIDWSRQFLTITPQYNKFIEWQYRNLKKQGLISKGEHPVRYCPNCDNAVGDHDLLEGEEAGINEFTVIKFQYGDYVLPAATLRPETVFGVTNMWINPEVEYVKAWVGEEKWILSKEGFEKLAHCREGIEKIGSLRGNELLETTCYNPVDEKEIEILPGTFVDPEFATGVVMSVPAHAPYDYMALLDLESDLEPIKIIDTSEEGIPAENIVEEMGIQNQEDQKLEEATEKVYAREHNKGTMASWIDGYGRMQVPEAREKVAEDLIEDGKGDLFYEFSEKPVICRCGTDCVIRIIKDQWFLRYDQEDWKQKARQCLENMDIVPGEVRQNFEYVIGWLNKWACARRAGLGTNLPWDEKWIIEPLSDSTIYMAYYTISKYLNEIDAEKIQDELFDYVFYGKGSLDEVSQELDIEKEKIESMREEFEYWYPLNWRLSAKDLVANHLTFHIFHHTALFPEDKWPRGVVVFGMGLLEGEKMSSSKGNIILLEDAIQEYGSDVVRLFLMSNAEPWQDFDWRADLVKNTQKKLKKFSDHVEYGLELDDNSIEERDIDRWLYSRAQVIIKETITALDNFQTRKALQHALYEFINAINWYLRRTSRQANSEILKEVTREWTKLMAPFTPFTCEELWEKIGKEELVSLASYPRAKEEYIDSNIIRREKLVKSLMQDIQSILKVTKQDPESIYVYLAPEWKRKLYKEIDEGKKIGQIMQDPEFRKHGKEAASIAKKTRPDEIPDRIFALDEEHETLSKAREFLSQEFDAEVIIQKKAEYDPKNKAKHAMPMKPGLYLE